MAFESFYELNVTRSGYAIPSGALGCWVTLLGAGGAGGRGWAAGAAARGGGGGAGGGGFIPRFWIPASSFGGATTYSTAIGAAGTVGVIGGTAQTDGGDTVFTLGSIVLTAGGGKKGGDGATNAVGAGGAGGTCSFSGITAGTSYSGGAGGNGGNYVAGSNAAGANGSNGSNGSGGGGGGGGGIDAGGTAPSWTTSTGGKGGDGNPFAGGASTAVNGTTPNHGLAGLLLRAGGAGSGGPLASGYTAVIGGNGGLGSGGGGSTGTNNTGARKLGGAGGDGAALVEWMMPQSSDDVPREYVALGDADYVSPYGLSWTHNTDGGANCVVLIPITINVNATTGTTTMNTAPTVTYAGTPALMVAKNDVGTDGRGAEFVYAVWNPPSGDSTISVSWSAGGTPYAAMGHSVSYQKAAGIRQVSGRQIGTATTSQTFTVTSAASSGRRIFMAGSHQGTYSSSFNANLLAVLSTQSRTLVVGDDVAGATTTFTYTTSSALGGFIGIEIVSVAEDTLGLMPAYVRSHSAGNRATGSSASLATSFSHYLDVSDANTMGIVVVTQSVSSSGGTTAATVTWGGNACSNLVWYGNGSGTSRNTVGIYYIWNPPTGSNTVDVTSSGTATVESVVGYSAVYHNVSQATATVALTVSTSPSGSSGVSLESQVLYATTTSGSIDYSLPSAGDDTMTAWRGGSLVGGIGDYSVVQTDATTASGPVSFTNGGTTGTPCGVIVYITGRQFNFGTSGMAVRKLAAAMTGEGRFEGPLAVSLQRTLASLTGAQTHLGTGPMALSRAVAALTGGQTDTGTAAASMQKMGFSGSGYPLEIGNIASTMQKPTMAATAEQQYPAVLGAVIQKLQGSFAGNTVLAAAMQKTTMAASGTQTYTGTIAASMLKPLAALSGTKEYVGTLAASMLNSLTSLTGGQNQTGTIAAALLKPLMAASGVQGVATITGTVAAAMQKMGFTGRSDPVMIATQKPATMAATGGQTHTGTIAAALQKLAGALTASQTFTSTVAATMLKPLAALTGGQTHTGTVGAALQKPTMAASGILGANATGTLAAALKKMTMLARSEPVIDARLQRPTMAAAGTEGYDSVLAARARTVFEYTFNWITSDFETVDWVVNGGASYSTDRAYSGITSFKMSSTTSGSIKRTIAVTPGDKVTVSFRASRTSDYNGTGGNAKLRFANDADNSQITSLPYGADNLTLADTWYLRTTNFIVPAGITTMRATFQNPDGSVGAVYIDDVVIDIRPNFVVMTGEQRTDGALSPAMQKPVMAASGTQRQTGVIGAKFVLAPLFGNIPARELRARLQALIIAGTPPETPIPTPPIVLLPAELYHRVVSDRQHVVIHTYDGVQIAQFTAERSLSLQWNRALREVSVMSLTVPPDAGYLIPEIHPWLYWASVWDDDGEELYWTGPIRRAAQTRRSLQIKAGDHSMYLKRTRVPVTNQWEARNPATIARELWDHMTESRGFNIEPVLLDDPRGNMFDFSCTQDDGSLSGVIDQLVQLGLYWSVVAGTPVLGPAPLEAIRALGEEHFQDDQIALVRDGTNTCNDVLLKVAGGASRARKPLAGLQLEKMVTIDDVAGVGNADRAAQEYIRNVGGIRTSIEMPEGAVLTPNAPVGIQELVPSIRFNIEAFDVLQTMELEAVSVSLNPNSIPQVGVTFESVDDDPPELVSLIATGTAASEDGLG